MSVEKTALSFRVVCVACVAVLVLLAVVVVRAEEGSVDDKDVTVLTKDNFSAFINDNELALVEFYAPWCGHCKHLAPEYAKAATELLKLDPPVRLGKVDATEESELAGRFDVSGYPTLKVMRDGAASPYNGPRTADGIVAYMKKQVGPASKTVVGLEELNTKFLANDDAEDYHVVGVFQPKTKSRIQSAFVMVAERMRDNFVFVRTTTSDDVRGEFGLGTDEEGIFVVRRDGTKVKYDGNTQTKNVQKFVESNRVAALGEYTKRNAMHYGKHPLPVAKLYTVVDWSGGNKRHTKYYWNRLRKLSEEFEGQLVFAIANRADFESELSEMAVEDVKAPFVISAEGGNARYLFDGEFGLQQLREFTKDFVDGKVLKWMKSEKVPEKNDGPVTIVVGRNFDEVVMNNSKDVMVEFYAPWCGHCKALAPKYEKLGQKFKNVDSVVIAKVDATANEWDRSKFEVSGYPTLYFKNARGKVRKYEGAREVKAMRSWIKRHAVSLK